MTKYWICGVDMGETAIERVRAFRVENKLVNPKNYTRMEVVKSIQAGDQYFTAIKQPDGKWEKRAEVHIIKVNGDLFLRTDRNQIKRDNLGELPSIHECGC